MQVRASILTPSVARGVTAMCAAVLVISAVSTALAAGVVGTGTAASCTDVALNTALAGGGLVTFDCGSDPVLIPINDRTIRADTTIDGGSLITLHGNNVAQLSVNPGVTFTVQNLTIFFTFLAISGTLTVNNSTLVGTHIGSFDSQAALTVSRSSLSGAGGCAAGVGIYNHGTAVIVDSTLSDNIAFTVCDFGGCCHGEGAGIYNDGTLTVNNSTLSGNSADEVGGAILNAGRLTVTNSTFSGNSASGGGAILNAGRLTVTNSTFSGNSTGAGGGAGILNATDGTLTVTNSTFSGNSTDARGGGISNGGTVTVTNSTFSGNSASGSLGGGIFNGSGPLTVTNTIVAKNTVGGNCSGSVTDGGHNIDDSATCGFTGTSLSNTNPQLDPAGLQDNGGPTQTVALCTAVGVPTGCIAASPAIDAGDESVCAAAPVNDRDQRGSVRPGTGHTQCSIGAYEADLVPSMVTATPTDTPTITAMPTDPPPTITATPSETSTTITAIATPTAMSTTIPATPTAKPSCTGDCNGNGVVAINELILGVNMALGNTTLDQCEAFDCNGDGHVTVDCIVRAVRTALFGMCPCFAAGCR